LRSSSVTIYTDRLSSDNTSRVYSWIQKVNVTVNPRLDLFNSKIYFAILIVELFSYISFNILKDIVTKPISDRLPEVIDVDHNIASETRFNNMHYLQCLYCTFKSIRDSSKGKGDPFSSLDYINKVRFKIESIYEKFNRRKEIFKYSFEGDKKPSFFDSFDVFKDQTTVEVMELTSRIVSTVIEIIKSKPNYYEIYHSAALFFTEIMVNIINYRIIVQLVLAILLMILKLLAI
jgi:hypothetical protein